MRTLLLASLSLATALPLRAQLSVTAIDPLIHAGNQPENASVRIDFDRALDPATLGELRVYGSFSGPLAGSVSVENGGTRLRFDPLLPYAAGEVIQIGISERMRAADGSALRTEGFVSSFRVAAAPAPMSFSARQSWDADPSTFARIYGAQTCDFNGDAYVDLALVCENTSDVRVYPASSNASGVFGALIGSPNATGAIPSPNENADLDQDGDIDIVTCDTSGNSFSVLLGNGDGTFQPSVGYPMGVGPRGLALLDANGDGYVDVATANVGSDNIALRLGNGDGTFGPAVFFGGDVTGEWALAAADMNNDYITDLVVGGRFGLEVRVLLSNGDGTFTPRPATSCGGQVWMLVCGDVDGDRDIDVSVANGPSNSGAILLGLGDGQLQSPALFAGAGQMTATDLGDLDGDGDLDWVLSSFGGGRWTVHSNDGAGGFSLQQTIFATSNPACAALFDIDRDGDLDMALMDEIADTCTIYENGALDALNLCFGDGSGTACPCGNSGASGHGCENSNGTGGALLNVQGRASVAADTLMLTLGGAPSSATVLFFQGAGSIAGGAGLPYRDGLYCIAAPTRRLGLEPAVNGFARRGALAGDPPLSLAGALPALGATVLYQAWYRDPAPFCGVATTNFSNAVRVVWTP